jgi:acyl-CoA synthetase (AMP-forming)/AMP-acid ligase II
MFHRRIAEAAARRPRALAYMDGKMKVTYVEMAQDIARCTAWMKTRGVKAGDRVVLHVESTYRHWLLFFAVEALGGIAAPAWTGQPLQQRTLTFLKADAFFSSLEPAGEVTVEGDVLGRGWLERLRKFRALPLPKRDRSGDDPICIILSSGTTGMPKKVLFTRDMVDRRTADVMGDDLINAESRVLSLVPIISIGGLVSGLNVWGTGGTLCVKQSDMTFPEALARMQPTMIGGAPGHFTQLLAELPADFTPRQPIDVGTGGAALPKAVATALRARLRGKITVAYGSTEMGVLTRGDNLEEDPSAVGYLLPWVEVEIRDADGTPLPRGEIGEVWVRGAEVVPDYLEDPDQTDRSFRDGWYHPGDLGALRADGMLTISGRTDELLNVGGMKALPSLIEAAILKLGVVRDAAVFMARAPGGEDRVLWVACVADRAFDPQALRPAIHGRAPFVVTVVDALPRNLMAKVERSTLRARAEAGELPATEAAAAA